jgi:hypothetical protein
MDTGITGAKANATAYAGFTEIEPAIDHGVPNVVVSSVLKSTKPRSVALLIASRNAESNSRP